MRKYFVIFVLLAIGCQDNSRYVDPTVKPDDSNKIEQSITEAQKARATDAANIMRKLASAIDAGEISTMKIGRAHV